MSYTKDPAWYKIAKRNQELRRKAQEQKVHTPSAQAGKVFDKLQQTVMNLFERWLDEKEYEDIKDYGKVIAPLLKKHKAKLVKMSKRPFGFTFTVEEFPDRLYQIKQTMTEYLYCRVS